MNKNYLPSSSTLKDRSDDRSCSSTLVAGVLGHEDLELLQAQQEVLLETELHDIRHLEHELPPLELPRTSILDTISSSSTSKDMSISLGHVHVHPGNPELGETLSRTNIQLLHFLELENISNTRLSNPMSCNPSHQDRSQPQGPRAQIQLLHVGYLKASSTPIQLPEMHTSRPELAPQHVPSSSTFKANKTRGTRKAQEAQGGGEGVGWGVGVGRKKYGEAGRGPWERGQAGCYAAGHAC